MSEVLNVEIRPASGTRESRRLRAKGLVPANLYGHGEKNLYLSVSADQVRSMVRHGARVVDLDGAVKDKAFVRELQWDTFGVDVLHLDLTRISADERVQVHVKVELKGEPIGAKDGGVLEHVLHEVEIDCLALQIPEKLFLRVNSLALDGSLTASAIELPPNVTLLTDAEEVVVNCSKPVEASEETEQASGAEPEVIGRKEKEEGEEDE
jgi:large subunit ribosomal protein L25